MSSTLSYFYCSDHYWWYKSINLHRLLIHSPHEASTISFWIVLYRFLELFSYIISPYHCKYPKIISLGLVVDRSLLKDAKGAVSLFPCRSVVLYWMSRVKQISMNGFLKILFLVLQATHLFNSLSCSHAVLSCFFLTLNSQDKKWNNNNRW